MQTIILKPLQHRGIECIGIYFGINLKIQGNLKKTGVVKFSNTNKCWYPGSIHALRHSFATHLLDKGTDVVMIMKLLGHNDLKTTMRYLHVTNRDMLQIISPLDNLKLE